LIDYEIGIIYDRIIFQSAVGHPISFLETTFIAAGARDAICRRNLKTA
jgi:hypothetical protein